MMNNTELFNGNINEIKENNLLITPSSDIFCVIKEDNQFYLFLFKKYNESYYWEKFSLLTENSYLLSHSMIENINNISYTSETQKLENGEFYSYLMLYKTNQLNVLTHTMIINNAKLHVIGYPFCII